MIRRLLVAVLAVPLLTVALSGCGTFRSYEKWPNTRCFIYSGVRYDLEGPRRSSGGAMGAAALAYAAAAETLTRWLDIPFSLVTDTLFLPGTITQCAVFRVTALEDAARQAPFLHGPTLDDGDMSRLARMKSITDVFLGGSRVTDKGAGRLGAMTHLQRLSLAGTRVTGASFKDWGDLRRLYSLDLSETRLNPRHLAALTRLPALRSLFLNRLNLNDDDLEPVGRLRGLRNLGLRHTRVGAGGFAHLRSLPHLKFLNLEAVRLDTDAVTEILRLPALEHVRLDHAQIAFPDLKRMAARRGMRQIQLARGQFPHTQLSALRKVNPRLKIYVGSPGSYSEFKP